MNKNLQTILFVLLGAAAGAGLIYLLLRKKKSEAPSNIPNTIPGGGGGGAGYGGIVPTTTVVIDTTRGGTAQNPQASIPRAGNLQQVQPAAAPPVSLSNPATMGPPTVRPTAPQPGQPIGLAGATNYVGNEWYNSFNGNR